MRVTEVISKIRELSKNRFVSGTIWSGISTLIGVAAAMGQTLLVKWFFGTAALGIFSQAYYSYIIFSVVVMAGVPRSVVKHVAESADEPERAGIILSSALQLITLASVFFMGLLYVFVRFSGFYAPEVQHILNLFLLSVALLSISRLFDSFFIGCRAMENYSISIIIRWALRIVALVTIGVLKMPLGHYALAFVLVEATVLCYQFFNASKIVSIKLQTLHTGWIKHHFNFGRNSFPTDVINELNNRTDVLLMGYFAGNYNTGIYTLCAELAKGIVTLTSTIRQNFEPIVSLHWKKGEVDLLMEKFRKIKVYNRAINLTVCSGIAVAFPVYLYLFAHDLFLFNQSYFVFYTMLAGAFYLSLHQWAFGFLTMAGLPLVTVHSQITIFLFSVTASTLCISFWGLTGAAVAFTVNSIAAVLIVDWYTHRHLGVHIRQ